MELLFLDLDFDLVKRYCLENRHQPYKTEIKRQSLGKQEKWYYFFKVLGGNSEYEEYITKNLRNYSVRSLEYAILYVMISDPDSEDEKKAYTVVYEKLQNIKKKSIVETMKKIQKALVYCDKTFKMPPAKEEQKKE